MNTPASGYAIGGESLNYNDYKMGGTKDLS
jgi:hypothetical protein